MVVMKGKAQKRKKVSQVQKDRKPWFRTLQYILTSAETTAVPGKESTGISQRAMHSPL